MVWDTPTQQAGAIEELRQRGYRALPLRRLYIPQTDGTGRQRPLSIPTMHDRAMPALSLLALDPIAETLGDPHAYGFRTERSTADAIEQGFNVLARQHAPQWMVEGDLRACFDGISHPWLWAHIPLDEAMLHKWLKAGCIDKHRLYPTDAGVPQGGMCSPVIANLTLDGLERLLRAHYPPNPKRAQRAKVNRVRDGDACMIPGSSQAVLEQEVTPLVEHFLHARGLELSQAKTHRTHIAHGCDFLGQHVRQYAGELLLTPAPQQVHTFLGNLRHIVKANKQATAGHLIAQLHPIIRGWANSHRHVVRKATCNKVDTAIFHTLWSWATRRHPKKPGRWSAQQYFPTRHGRRWTFVGTRVGRRGQPQARTLCRAGDVPIQRHVKITGTANPDDPPWEGYCEERLRVQMSHALKGRRQLLYRWKQPDGLGPVCHQPITRLTGWHNHHRVWRTSGGSDTADNRVLLHPTCHRQVQSQALDGAPSRSARSV
jgi:RNA-directed DNA polymerase